MNEIAANYGFYQNDLRRPIGFGRRPFYRPWGFRPGFGAPFAAGLLGGLAAGALIGGPYYGGYPYYPYPPYPYPYYPY
ncbi:hypothetical protein [Niallia sp. BSM11]|uniref:hypothetical protein n=1 Tax=Niallia sp. BSM11 TaxID=3391576 RepID=UPI003984EFFE